MPTYQYACTDCGHRFEQVQAFSDASLTDCPLCGGKLRKVYGSVGVVFKGTGFYRTDSRSGAASAVANGGEKSDSGSSPETGKTAAKEPVKAAAKSSDSGSSTASSGNGSSSNGSSGSGSSSNGSSSKPAAAANSKS